MGVLQVHFGIFRVVGLYIIAKPPCFFKMNISTLIYFSFIVVGQGFGIYQKNYLKKIKHYHRPGLSGGH